VSDDQEAARTGWPEVEETATEAVLLIPAAEKLLLAADLPDEGQPVPVSRLHILVIGLVIGLGSGLRANRL
jgi:hypothetical protein